MRQRLPQWWPHDRRKAQGGSTLVELLVTVVIIGLALTLIVGTFSAGLLQSAIAKRNTAASGAVQYELDEVAAAPYGSLPAQYSDCFADEDAASPPTTLAAFQGNCPTSAYSLRVDVSQRQQFIAQSMQLEGLHREIVTALASIAVRNNDEQLKGLLASQGINLGANPGPAGKAK